MTLGSVVWPRSGSDLSQKAVVGRFLHVVFSIIGAIPLAIELVLHRYWPHIAAFAIMFLALNLIGRILRYLLARE